MRSRFERLAAPLAGALAALACLAVVTATPPESFWIVDCGSRALLAERLLDTGFRSLELEHPAAALDPEGLAFPARGFAVRRGDGFVSIFPPAYSALAAPWLAWLGPAGLRVPAALGVAACAWLFALWLTPVAGPGRALAGALVLALATPLFFYGVTVWDHSLSVAGALGAAILVQPARAGRLAAAGFVLGATCWLREELGLFGLALAGVCALRERRPAPLAWLAAGAVLPVAGLLAFNSAAYGHPLGVHLSENLQPAGAAALSAGERLRQLGGILVGYGADGREAALLGLAAVGALGAGWLGARRFAWATGVSLALALAVWAHSLARSFAGPEPLEGLVRYNGLLARMPLVCSAGAGLAALSLPAFAPLRSGVWAGLGFLALALVAGLGSQAYFGFGVHWGPRMLLPGAPALVALFAVALTRASPGWRRAAAATLVAAGVLSSAQSVWFLAHQKAEGRRLQAAILAAPAQVVVTGHPLLSQHLAGLWRRKPMLLADDGAALARVLAELRRGGVSDLVLLAPPETPALSGPDLRCRIAERHRGRRLHYLDADLQLCRLPPARGLRPPAASRPRPPASREAPGSGSAPPAGAPGR